MVSQHFAKVPSFGACKFKSCTLLFFFKLISVHHLAVVMNTAT